MHLVVDHWPAALAFVVGVVAWTLTEYTLHRFLGHDKRTMPNFFSVEHTRHHSEGNYFAPTWKKGLFAVLVCALTFAALRAVLAFDVAVAGTLGFGGMYALYEVIHRRAHTHAGVVEYARYMRRHHFHHHFVNPRANHGVTSPVWDHVFGTYEPVTEIRVPKKLAMRWLVDPSTGDVWPRFAHVYRLMGTHAPS